MESKFNQIFHKLPDPLSSSLGSWDMDTMDYCTALTSSRLSRWNVMTPGGWHLFFDKPSKAGKIRKQTGKKNPKSYQYKHILHVPSRKESRNSLYEIIRTQNHSPHTFFSEWYGNLRTKYLICSFCVIYPRQCAKLICINNQDFPFLFK